jgi:hypothetical protein
MAQAFETELVSWVQGLRYNSLINTYTTNRGYNAQGYVSIGASYVGQAFEPADLCSNVVLPTERYHARSYVQDILECTSARQA